MNFSFQKIKFRAKKCFKNQNFAIPKQSYYQKYENSVSKNQNFGSKYPKFVFKNKISSLKLKIRFQNGKNYKKQNFVFKN